MEVQTPVYRLIMSEATGYRMVGVGLSNDLEPFRLCPVGCLRHTSILEGIIGNKTFAFYLFKVQVNLDFSPANNV
jgi:hypothetical protein